MQGILVEDLPSGKFEPRHAVRFGVAYQKLDGDRSNGISVRYRDEISATDGPAIAENFYDLIPRIFHRFGTYRGTDLSSAVQNDTIFRRAFHAIRHDRTVRLHVEILSWSRVDQPRMLLAVSLKIICIMIYARVSIELARVERAAKKKKIV